MPPTYNEADSKLINDLRQLAERKSGRRKLVKAATYNAPADENIQVVSWKMDEFKYYDIPSPFPTLARGLFTTELDGKTDDGGSRHRIVARGYDKFFNIGEVPWTTWDAIKKETKGPYTLTLKSNGCIIFISALTPDKLLICSKHSLGAVGNREESHAQVGERWLEKHLKCVGKTKEDLARTLWEKNWTAVAELCDDEFEEHVLPYPPDKSGLHLHGLNESTGLFRTQPTPVVDAFARDWGFIVTASLTLPTADEVQRFSEDVGRTGKWEGEAVEGFVVRTTVVDPPTGLDGDARKSPYAPGSSFFFKIKFAEPYMMYRDWREVTKTLLAAKGPLDAVSLPKSKMSRPETKMYAKWVTKEITRDREPFEHFNEGRGIIAARERFLQWLASQEGKDAVKADADEEKTGADSKEFGKTIIVPVAVPGVGKTAIAVALKHLFGFAHTQSDDIKGKNSAPRFVKNVFELLKTHDVVIADKNNHLSQHREQLRDAVKDMSPPVRLLALSWSLSDRPQATIHRICADRVLARGTNHQSLHGDASARAHESVIWQFLAGAEELGDKEVDAVIDMDVGEDIEDALDRAIDGVTRVLGLSPPSREKIGEALAAVRGYVPASVDAKAIRPVPIRYFGLLPEINFHAVLAPTLEAADAPLRAKELWAALKEAGRTTARPHVTLAHMKGMDDPIEKGVWDRCAALHTSPRPPTFRFRLGRALCDGRVLAVTVEELAVNGGEDDDQAGQEFVAMLPANVRERLHVTVGMRDGDVKPVEAKAVVERFNRGEIGDIEEVVLPDAWVTGRVKGLTA